ncbi:ATP-binding protein [Reichenbachiella sp.]|uniref:ATP-binding protein n=1 Tax=Reichenbachiella sp. TaxID=2184521 RepID=UPI003BB0B574
MKVSLTQPQRIIVSILYLVILSAIFILLGGNLNSLAFEVATDRSIWFYSGALLIILGKYVAEPYFTKPTDSLTNSMAVIIALISLNNKSSLFGYGLVLGISMSVLILTLVSISIKASEKPFYKWLSVNSYWYVVNIGSSKVLFSLIYLSSIYSYLALGKPQDLTGFIVLLAFWICLIFFDIIGKFVEFVTKFRTVNKELKFSLGKAIGCENPLLYKVEIDSSGTGNVKNGRLVAIENTRGSRAIGIIINVRQLINKKWISIYLLTDEKGYQLKIPSPSYFLASSNSLFYQVNEAYFINTIEELPPELKEVVSKNYFYLNRDKFCGFVERGTNLNSLRFHLLNKNDINKISEGSILSVNINTQNTLFQVIDGLTFEENLENQDKYGFTIGVARKLGYYNLPDKELNVVSWMPEMYAPVFNHLESDLEEKELKDIADNAIGRLPGSNYQIPIKNINELVTHNTAILGILGIGKSCLTFELLQKSRNEIEDLKIICIDITNEYSLDEKLPSYIPKNEIVSDTENIFSEIDANYEYIETVGTGNYAKLIPERSGNINDYKKAIRQDVLTFLFGNADIPSEYVISKDKRVRIYNPDYHKVSKGEKMGIHVLTPPLSPAEKTRVIAEEILKVLMHFKPNGGKKANVLLVFEEAHSLVPEWNSVANEGDKAAANGTAKIILQGRKYGLGSLVITQRTANISKSILNQCNTIFALRVFDDTGKQFLENYIGSDYSNTLPTLEERHAIIVGKALRLKQPVIVQLNDMKYIKNDQMPS